MEDLVEDLTNGHVTGVKIVLASVIVALAVYQVFLMGVGFGRIRLRFLKPRAAALAHRTVGDTVLVLAVLVAVMCISYFETEGEDGEELRVRIHVLAGSLTIGVLALKVVVLRWWRRLDRFIPALGITLFALFGLTWLTSAGDYLWGS